MNCSGYNTGTITLGNLYIGDGSTSITVEDDWVTSNMTIAGTFTITANSQYSQTWGDIITLSATSTPLVINGNGIFNGSYGTVLYTGNGATIACTGATYYNLSLKPSSSTAQIICTGASQSLLVTFSLVVGDGTVGHAGATGATYNPDMEIDYTTTVSSNATFTTGTGTIILGWTLTITGTLTITTGNTINYTGDAGKVTCTGASYYNLGIKSVGSTQIDVCTATSQTLAVTNNLVIGDGTAGHNGANADTYDPNITVGGNMTIAANATYTKQSDTA